MKKILIISVTKTTHQMGGANATFLFQLYIGAHISRFKVP